MKILADENVERPIVEYLRDRGHDVLYAAEAFASTPDPEILSRALSEQRIILTNDLDFGELIFHRKMGVQGMVLEDKRRVFESQWPLAEPNAIGHFVVITNRSIRIRPLA
jgi:hypothetical protein